MRRISICLMCAGILAVALLVIYCGRSEPARPPFLPREALKKFRIDERFKIELFAAEPLLDGPVSMTFDSRGRVFVFESPAFPPKPSDTGRTKLLEDSDGDGLPDRSVLYPAGKALPELPSDWKTGRDRTSDAEGNGFLTSPASHVQYQAPGSAPRDISDHGASASIFPITEYPEYPVLTAADRTTSTCGIAYYSSTAVPGFGRALFTAEPVHNLVHCDLLSRTGAGFVARRAREGAEFLASSDPWFRPVSFAVAPDGTLYIVDYYAPVAGPTEVLEVGVKPSDRLFNAVGRGRIYKVTPRPEVKSPLTPEVEAGGEVTTEPESTPDTPDLHRDPAGLETLIGNPQVVDTVQAAAVRELGRLSGEAPGAFLLSKWRALTTRPRAEAVEALFRDRARLEMLLAALEKGQIPLWCLDNEHRVRLLAGGDRVLADRTRRLLEAHESGKDPVVKKYEASLGRSGDRNAGEMIYRRLCGRCHTYRGGSNYGPDLWTVSSRPPRRILIDILLPSDSIAAGRELFMIDLRGGGVEGIIGSQTDTSLNILHDESRQETVFRRDITRMLMADFSAMPVDLASQISVPEMADLLAFLTAR